MTAGRLRPFMKSILFAGYIAGICAIAALAAHASDRGIIQMVIPTPDPANAGQDVTFQVIAVNSGSTSWQEKSYTLQIEIYDMDGFYLTRSGLFYGQSEFSAGSKKLFYLAFKIPVGYRGFYKYKIILNKDGRRITESPYNILQVLSIPALEPERKPSVEISGNATVSYTQYSDNQWANFYGLTNLNLIGRLLDRTFLFNSYTYHDPGHRTVLDTILLNMYGSHVNFSLGDAMPEFTALTLTSQVTRGAAFYVETERYRARAAAGQTVSPEKGDETSNGVFARYLYGSMAGIKLPINITVDGSYVASQDHESSLSLAEGMWGPTLVPVKNDVWASRISVNPVEPLSVRGEFARSRYWEDTYDAPNDMTGDSAWHTEAEISAGNLLLKGTWKRIEPFFYSLGSPQVNNDTIAYDCIGTFSYGTFRSLILGYDYSRSNLDNDPEKTTTEQKILSAGGTWSYGKLPDISVYYTHNSVLGVPVESLDNRAETYSVSASKRLGFATIACAGQYSHFYDRTGVSHNLDTYGSHASLSVNPFSRIYINAGWSYSWTEDLRDFSTDTTDTYSSNINWQIIRNALTLIARGMYIRRRDNDIDIPALTRTVNAGLELSTQITALINLTAGYSIDTQEDRIDSGENYRTHGILSRLTMTF